MNRIPLVEKYNAEPELYVSRLAAAVEVAKYHDGVDANKIAVVGYCFGGSAVLQFAKLGGAEAAGVAAVASFHGGLGGVVAPNTENKYCPTRVAVYQGAADTQIPYSDIAKLETALEHSQTVWEVTTYAGAGHGFTHPSDGTDHFHYEQAAEERSWSSMSGFVVAAWDAHASGHLNVSTCVHVAPQGASPTTTTAASGGSSGGSGACEDDNAAVAAAAGAWGVTECSPEYCSGQYESMMKPLCPKTCGDCSSEGDVGGAPCKDDNEALAAAAGAWGITQCRSEYCTNKQYQSMVRPVCPETCGLCSTTTTTSTTTDGSSNDDIQTSGAALSNGIRVFFEMAIVILASVHLV